MYMVWKHNFQETGFLKLAICLKKSRIFRTCYISKYSYKYKMIINYFKKLPHHLHYILSIYWSDENKIIPGKNWKFCISFDLNNEINGYFILKLFVNLFYTLIALHKQTLSLVLFTHYPTYKNVKLKLRAYRHHGFRIPPYLYIIL
jgi:hypothetical protein